MNEDVVLVTKEDDLSEALALVNSLKPRHVEVIKLRNTYRPDTRTYVRKGKLSKLKSVVDGLSNNGYGNTKLVIYDTLYPRQVVNLMRELNVDVIDKIMLILEIFALHAGSKEAKLQIEMARILHQLPLIREWVRRAKLRELPGFLGPGAYAIDKYYQHLKSRLSRIRRELDSLRFRRELERSKRRALGFPHIAITGYANAGKTTLFNKLVGECKPAGPEMFTTLTPKAKRAYMGGLTAIVVDTVGFVRSIPAEIVEAFYATLEEVSSSDLTLLVLDSSEGVDSVLAKLRSSLSTLSRIGYVGKPIVIALNKIDLCSDRGRMVEDAVRSVLPDTYPWRWGVVRISALEEANLDVLKEVTSDFIRKEKAGLRTEDRSQTRKG
ncbi:MAG: GTPase HflX [Desulfurococcales archaeon]|nr:GTPase HflX [Desulfurococcales archaeon]